MEWEHTANIMSIINNVNASKRKHLKGPDYFNQTIPKEKKKEPGKVKITMQNFHLLKNKYPNVTGDKKVWDAFREQRRKEKEAKEENDGS